MMLAACSEEERLPGERVSIRVTGAVITAQKSTKPANLPPVTANLDWTHPGGSAFQSLSNPALSKDLSPKWAVRVSPALRPGSPVSEPIVAEGTIFTLGGSGLLAATSVEGDILWTVTTIPEGEDPSAAVGGGISYSQGRIFVATSFGELRAISPKTGETLWSEMFPAPFRSAPTVERNRVVIKDASDTAYGIETDTGRRIWQIRRGVETTSSVVTPPPAIIEGLALIAFSSGELLAIAASNGQQQWGLSIGSGRRDLARGIITDSSGGPVIEGENVYIANQSGTLLALNGANASREWQIDNGVQDRIAVAGDSIYAMTDRAVLLRAARDDGAVIWARDFAQTDTDAQSGGRITYHGPIVAGNRLILASSAGDIFELDPNDGTDLNRFSLPKGAAAAPVVANATLYLFSRDGLLFAYQ